MNCEEKIIFVVIKTIDLDGIEIIWKVKEPINTVFA